jgi:hypothetical protein
VRQRRHYGEQQAAGRPSQLRLCCKLLPFWCLSSADCCTDAEVAQRIADTLGTAVEPVSKLLKQSCGSVAVTRAAAHLPALSLLLRRGAVCAQTKQSTKQRSAQAVQTGHQDIGSAWRRCTASKPTQTLHTTQAHWHNASWHLAVCPCPVSPLVDC